MSDWEKDPFFAEEAEASFDQWISARQNAALTLPASGQGQTGATNQYSTLTSSQLQAVLDPTRHGERACEQQSRDIEYSVRFIEDDFVTGSETQVETLAPSAGRFVAQSMFHDRFLAPFPLLTLTRHRSYAHHSIHRKNFEPV